MIWRRRRDPPETTSQWLARWISNVGHPFVLIVFFVFAGSGNAMSWPRAFALTGLVIAMGIGPILLYLLRLVRHGRSNFDVSARELRGPVYALGLLLGGLLIATVRWYGAPPGVLIAMGCALAMVMLAALINFWLKVSLHSAFAIWVSVGFLGLDPRIAAGLFVLTLGVVWSRLHLKRHSPGEVAAGLVLGALMAGVMLAAVGRFGAP